ncbi:hypothetical protein N7452_002414 [Penicillium brevicompactum]|uniref:Uncharacterized protein n=1 Tax=Penicillium brevicompactum TaxID=5074 RepID=A0A9W9ULH8_PENBR|nr:hypothetical protein N7452_002414 [Penicillium brevicompactum]
MSRLHRRIHSAAVASWVISAGWAFVGIFILWMLGYDRHPEVKKLKPWVPLSPFVTSFGVFNYPTGFFQYVESGMVRVHIDDIDHLAPSAVCLKRGKSLQSLALVCATGWKNGPGFPITSADGQAIYPPRADPKLLVGARSHLYGQFRGLAHVPVATQTPHHESQFPSNLARFMVPLDRLQDRSIVFLGRVETPHTAILAQAQALWGVAYLGGQIKLGEPHERCRYDEPAGQCNALLCLEWESNLQGEFCRMMAPPGRTKRKPQLLLDALLYVDVLLADLGLDSRQSGNCLFLEMFHRYGPRDYRGLVDEWKDRH